MKRRTAMTTDLLN